MNIQLQSSAPSAAPLETLATLYARFTAAATSPSVGASVLSSASPAPLLLQPADVLEIHGRTQSGQSTFLYQHLLSCVLPPCRSQCALIDCDGRFNVERLRQMMQARGIGEAEERRALRRVQVLQVYSEVEMMAALRMVERMCEDDSQRRRSRAQDDDNDEAAGEKAKLKAEREASSVQAYLQSRERPVFHSRDEADDSRGDGLRLSHVQAISALPLPPHSASSFFSPPPDHLSPSPSPFPTASFYGDRSAPSTAPFSLLLIDNIAAFYWASKAAAPRSGGAAAPSSAPGPSFMSCLCSLLSRVLSVHRLACVVTKPVLFRGSGEALERELQHVEYMAEEWKRLVRYRLLLRAGAGEECAGMREARLVACREEEREGKRLVRGSILQQHCFVISNAGVVFT